MAVNDATRHNKAGSPSTVGAKWMLRGSEPRYVYMYVKSKMVSELSWYRLRSGILMLFFWGGGGCIISSYYEMCVIVLRCTCTVQCTAAF